MPAHCVLLFTDVEGSTQLTEQLGDEAASLLWSAHDRVARELLRRWRGREIDKSDGFLLLFEAVDDALAFALDLHHELAGLTPPVASRAGIHRGTLVERENPAVDVAMGAKPVEVDGVAKAVASRIMALARGGQTLLSAAAHEALGEDRWRTQSHGHWRMKGLAEPIELFEAGHAAGALPMLPPPDSAKSYRVLRADEGWMPVARLRHGLPAERDGFVGRGEALAALAARLDGGARLVTLMGIGGIGKTRLALRYARDWLCDYPGGAWFCDLSSARSLDGIVHAVAQGLDVPLGKTDPVQQLGAAIAGRGECLVILDNFEQVARHAEATVGQWLERAPQVRLLVTSREVLGVVGEETFVLAPLPTDEAVLLFERRARAADGRYAAGDEDRAVLARLVELLDRLPLAIELAAARVRVMSPQAMLDRMGERFKLLASSGGRRDRQATLRAALDWSWELLSLVEQSALAQLSVFEGGFTLEAAEAVVELASADVWMADVVQALIEKSLVRAARARRLEMLRTVQDYAHAQLSARPAEVREAAHRRHWRHFAAFDEGRVGHQRCDDTDNFIVAARRATDAGDHEAAVATLVLSAAVLEAAGPVGPLLELAQRVQALPGVPAAQRASVARVVGNVHYAHGRCAEALAQYRAGLEQAEAAQHAVLVARLNCALSDPLWRSGDVEAARAHLLLAARAADVGGDAGVRQIVLNARGALALGTGHFEEARGHYLEALAAARQSGHRRREGGVLGNLGIVHRALNEPEQAAECYAQAISIGQEVGDRRWTANARCNLGRLHVDAGLHGLAQAELRACVQTARDIGHSVLEANAQCNLGRSLLGSDRVSEALVELDSAAAIAERLADWPLALECWLPLGQARARSGEMESAKAALGRARDLATRLGDAGALAQVDQRLAELSESASSTGGVSTRA